MNEETTALVRILVVDDEKIVRSLLVKRLKKEGYDAIEAEDGAEAIRLVDESPPDLILLDLMMPGMNGIQLLEELREARKHVFLPVIVMSARGEVEDKVDALAQGADDYITKPFEFPELLARIRVQLRIVALQDRLADAERLRGVYQMAATICHELSQPLTVLVGYTHMLLKEADESSRKMLEQVEDSAQRAAEIIKKIQHIRRYETKNYTAHVSMIDLDRASDSNRPFHGASNAEKQGPAGKEEV